MQFCNHMQPYIYIYIGYNKNEKPCSIGAAADARLASAIETREKKYRQIDTVYISSSQELYIQRERQTLTTCIYIYIVGMKTEERSRVDQRARSRRGDAITLLRRKTASALRQQHPRRKGKKQQKGGEHRTHKISIYINIYSIQGKELLQFSLQRALRCCSFVENCYQFSKRAPYYRGYTRNNPFYIPIYICNTQAIQRSKYIDAHKRVRKRAML